MERPTIMMSPAGSKVSPATVDRLNARGGVARNPSIKVQRAVRNKDICSGDKFAATCRAVVVIVCILAARRAIVVLFGL